MKAIILGVLFFAHSSFAIGNFPASFTCSNEELGMTLKFTVQNNSSVAIVYSDLTHIAEGKGYSIRTYKTWFKLYNSRQEEVGNFELSPESLTLYLPNGFRGPNDELKCSQPWS